MAEKILQCKKCSRLYQPLGTSPYCPVCMEELETNFELVKNYIYENPNANVVEISKETEVSEKDILYFLKEGRLSVAENNGMLQCEKCGCSIGTGRYCEDCKTKLERALSASVNEAIAKVKQPARKGKESSLGKMHIDYRDR